MPDASMRAAVVEQRVGFGTRAQVPRGQRVNPGAAGTARPISDRRCPRGGCLDHAGPPDTASVDPYRIVGAVTVGRGYVGGITLVGIEGGDRHDGYPSLKVSGWVHVQLRYHARNLLPMQGPMHVQMIPPTEREG